MSLELDYFYEGECEKFAFYQVPKVLFKNKVYKKLSSNAKLLYGLMLDRVSLSRKNQWIDEFNRVYIYYTVEDVIDDLGCSRQTAINSIDELDSKKGIGLIEKKRQGLGKPTKIYVKDFSSILNKTEDKENEDSVNEEGVKMPQNPSNSAEVQNLDFKKSSTENSRSLETRLQEVQNLDFNSSKNQTSESLDFRSQEVKDLDGNNTNSNKTYLMDNKNSNNHSINHSNDDDGVIDYSDYIAIVKQNISFNVLTSKYNAPSEARIIESIVSMIADILCFERKEVYIGKNRYPYKIVKEKFEQLEYDHIDYVLKSLNSSTTKIKNIKAYLLTTLYNSLDTIDIYYQAEANHDLNK